MSGLKQCILQQIKDIGIVPVVRATSPKHAHLAVEALRAGGIPVVEITMTVPGAVKVISELAKAGEDLLIGAGTVLDADVAGDCLQAGAKFLVTPGFDANIVRFADQCNVPIFAGALTPTEIMEAMKAGADAVKIFPCAQVGGPAYIKALRGPFPKVPFIPTGGVSLENAADFLLAGATALGAGGELVDKVALESGDSGRITENARRFIEIVQRTRDRLSPIGAAQNSGAE